MGFQFPGQKSLPRDLQMDMASPWQLKWASFLAMGLLVQILFSRHSLCIYPYVKTCPFFLRPTFFSKNQPTQLAPRTKKMWILWQDMVQKATKFFSSKKPAFFGHH